MWANLQLPSANSFTSSRPLFCQWLIIYCFTLYLQHLNLRLCPHTRIQFCQKDIFFNCWCSFKDELFWEYFCWSLSKNVPKIFTILVQNDGLSEKYLFMEKLLYVWTEPKANNESKGERPKSLRSVFWEKYFNFFSPYFWQQMTIFPRRKNWIWSDKCGTFNLRVLRKTHTILPSTGLHF